MVFKINDIISRNKFLFLLVSLLTFFIAVPFIVDNEFNRYIFGTSFSIVMVFSIYVIEHDKRLIMFGIFLGALVFIANWAGTILNLSNQLLLIDYSITAIFFTLITVIALHYVINDTVITRATLFGAICGYLLIGLTWSFIYVVLFLINHDYFHVAEPIQASTESRLQQFIYYSFVTLSTLGYGDMIPVSSLAKTLSWLEAITGQIYLTVWIAHLVGLHIAQRDRGNNHE